MGDDNFGSYQNKNDLVRGTIGMEFDADRYTVNQAFDQQRRGTNAFALKMKENYKRHLKEMDNIKEDDELYDPYDALQQ